ncbi:hypothetical protein DFP72DRAFT_861265 [Ephemerocybe angulata]|uniref:Uncharacterized protein n=1 Tax=Ephemerocybe angulata TaxID=980116 RepID=A0A8H6LTD8_9AGAR|nr:hypothetical protein DFP72DRAFT_861265 [Tulosesus angulatus]
MSLSGLTRDPYSQIPADGLERSGIFPCFMEILVLKRWRSGSAFASSTSLRYPPARSTQPIIAIFPPTVSVARQSNRDLELREGESPDAQRAETRNNGMAKQSDLSFIFTTYSNVHD